MEKSTQKIKVVRPFALRLGSDKPVHEFGVGEHEISKEECEHWFMQACIADGRAYLLSENKEKDIEEKTSQNKEKDVEEKTPQTFVATKETLEALTVRNLQEIAAIAEIELASRATKQEIVDSLLAVIADCTVIQTENGFEIKAAE